MALLAVALKHEGLHAVHGQATVFSVMNDTAAPAGTPHADSTVVHQKAMRRTLNAKRRNPTPPCRGEEPHSCPSLWWNGLGVPPREVHAGDSALLGWLYISKAGNFDLRGCRRSARK